MYYFRYKYPNNAMRLVKMELIYYKREERYLLLITDKYKPGFRYVDISDTDADRLIGWGMKLKTVTVL